MTLRRKTTTAAMSPELHPQARVLEIHDLEAGSLGQRDGALASAGVVRR